MLVKTLLNQMEKFKGFVFGKIGLREGENSGGCFLGGLWSPP